jgi:uncharacterized protein (TIGR02246 family)
MHMSNTLRSNPAVVLAMTALAFFSPTASAHAEEGAKAAITRQLGAYEQALNASDVDAVMKLYATDVVFMPQNSPPVEGRDAVRAAYRRVFAAIKLDVRFAIDEVTPLSRDWAFARTRSAGTVKLLGGDKAQMPEANQELFLLHREPDGQWRFARYIFSATNPPK